MVVSVLLHSLAAVVLWRYDGRLVVSSLVPIEYDVRVVPPEGREVSEPLPSGQVQGSLPLVAVPLRRSPLRRSAASVPLRHAPAPAGSAAPSSDPGLLGMRRRGSLDLQVFPERLETPGRTDGSHGAATAAAPLRPGRRTILEGAADLAREAEARQVVALGRVHPLYFDYLRDANDIFQPTRELAITLARAQLGQDASVGRWTKRYFGDFLKALGPQEKTPDAHFRRALQNAAQTVSTRACVVTLPGRVVRIEVARRSGLERLDVMAEAALSRAIARRPMDAPEAPGRACYVFSITLGRFPPLPMFSCLFTAKLDVECNYPFKEIVTTSVRLDGFEPAANASPFHR